MSYELVIGAGIICFLLLYLAKMIDEKEHFALRLAFIGFAVILLIPIGKGIIDSSQTCESVINSTREPTPTDNVTFYTYTTHCYSVTDSTTHNSVYKMMIYIFLIFSAYIIFYFVYYIFKHRAAEIMQKVQYSYKRRKKK